MNMRKHKVCVSICVELDEGTYFPERYQLTESDVLSIKSKMADDAEQYIMEILVQEVLKSSVEDLGGVCVSMWSTSESWDAP
jgi:hypothetical protein